MTQYRVPVLEQFSWQPPIIDKDLTAPPGGESKGDRYIVASGGSGDWTGLDGHIVTYDGSNWLDDTPAEGWECWVSDEDKFYYYDGSNWTAEANAAVSAAVSQTQSRVLVLESEMSQAESRLLVVESEAASNDSEILLLESEVSQAESATVANSGAISAAESELDLVSEATSQALSEVATKQSGATFDASYGVLLFEV